MTRLATITLAATVTPPPDDELALWAPEFFAEPATVDLTIAVVTAVEGTGTKLPTRFGWQQCKSATDKHHFPLGHTVYTTSRFTPSRYRLTISGGRNETTTHDFDIEWSDSSWPANWSQPVRVVVDPSR